jgi:glucosylceramidase
VGAIVLDFNIVINFVGMNFCGKWILGGAVLLGGMALGGAPASAQGEGKVRVYATTNDRSADFRKETLPFGERQGAAAVEIRLNPAIRYQTMDGFGAALTGSSCYNLLQMKKEDRSRFLKETFSDTEGMGYSYIRLAIGCSDFSLSEYTCWDDQLAEFALTAEETDYVIPVLKEILAIQPDIRILGSPWTCPRWMKVNNLVDMEPYESWTDGQLNPIHYQAYAAYFVQWILAFAREGITVHAITPQNEPLNRGNSASLFMGWQEQHDFVKTALIPHFDAARLDTKIYLFDHNYNYDDLSDQSSYPLRIYAQGLTDERIAGAAYHNYGGHRSELINIHNAFPDKKLIFTEASIGTWNDGRNLASRLVRDMREIGLGTVNNWCKAVIVWNLMLDSERGPNREGGCRTCFGAVDIDRSDYRTITRNSHYYLIGHLSAVVKPGATRIACGGEPEGIVCSAFENTDGSYAAVLLNHSSEYKNITIADGSHSFAYSLAPQSVASFQWNK